MRYTPKTEAEIKAEKVFPAGEYDIEIIGGEEKTSKKGNAMLALKVRVYVEDRQYVLTDYLLDNQPERLLELCKAIGLEKLYYSGEVTPEDLRGYSCRATVFIDDKNEQYGAQNRIKKYIKPKGAEQKRVSEQSIASANEEAELNVDDIPF